jgi:hypothetical protein
VNPNRATNAAAPHHGAMRSFWGTASMKKASFEKNAFVHQLE